MSEKPNNPSAFPGHWSHAEWESGNVDFGMSLRDWFAGQALAGVMHGVTGLGAASYAERMAALTMMAGVIYEVADAMLAERERKA